MVLTGDRLYVKRTRPYDDVQGVAIDDSKECIFVAYEEIEELCEHLQHLLLTRPQVKP